MFGIRLKAGMWKIEVRSDFKGVKAIAIVSWFDNHQIISNEF